MAPPIIASKQPAIISRIVNHGYQQARDNGQQALSANGNRFVLFIGPVGIHSTHGTSSHALRE